MRLSVRALTYRLERIHKLTGTNPADPVHRYSLQTAVIGASSAGATTRSDPSDSPLHPTPLTCRGRRAISGRVICAPTRGVPYAGRQAARRKTNQPEKYSPQHRADRSPP